MTHPNTNGRRTPLPLHSRNPRRAYDVDGFEIAPMTFQQAMDKGGDGGPSDLRLRVRRRDTYLRRGMAIHEFCARCRLDASMQRLRQTRSAN